MTKPFIPGKLYRLTEDHVCFWPEWKRSRLDRMDEHRFKVGTYLMYVGPSSWSKAVHRYEQPGALVFLGPDGRPYFVHVRNYPDQVFEEIP